MEKNQLLNAILNVMKSVDYVQKNGHNSFHKYNYATEQDILAKIRPAMIEQGLVLIPSATIQQIVGDMVYIETEYKLFHVVSGESMSFKMIGSGQDKTDKAVYKSLTGCHKYALMKLFNIATGDDPEHDAATDHHETAGQDQPTNGNNGNGSNGNGHTLQAHYKGFKLLDKMKEENEDVYRSTMKECGFNNRLDIKTQSDFNRFQIAYRKNMN